MNTKQFLIICSIVLAGLFILNLAAGFLRADAAGSPASSDRLAVVWSSDDPEVASKVCFMYTHNAKKQSWFDEVTLIVWGPSSKLLAEDEKLQKDIRQMQADGVNVEACIVCANMYNVVPKLRELGITVKPMGKPLSDYLKQGWKVISF